MSSAKYALLVGDTDSPQYNRGRSWDQSSTVGEWQRASSTDIAPPERPPSRAASNHGGDIEMKQVTAGKIGGSSDNQTTTTYSTEREYANFPSRDTERELRTIRRQVAISLAVKPRCVRDVAWLDSKLAKQTAVDNPEPGGTNYTPFPHLPANLATSLGIVDMRPAEPHWEGGRDPSSLYKLDTWFLAGAQHFLRSQTTGAPGFFLRLPDIEAFEHHVKHILGSLPSTRYVSRTSSFLEKIMNNMMSHNTALLGVEEMQETLHSEKSQYLKRCLMVCYNLKRLRFWLWRQYNRECWWVEFGTIMLSRAVHEVLHEVGRLNGDTIVESLELLKLQPNPNMPVYNRSQFRRDELIEAAEKYYALNPTRDGGGRSNLARSTFEEKGAKFRDWSDCELRSYALPDDDQWRTLKLTRIQPKSAAFDRREEYVNLPTYHTYHTRMNLARRIEARWSNFMELTQIMPSEYGRCRFIDGKSVDTDIWTMPDVTDDQLESIWDSITDHRDRYIFKVPKPLRRSASMPNVRAKLWLDPVPSIRDTESINLGFTLDRLPTRAPPRVYKGRPPEYPALEHHPFCPSEVNDTSHSFIVIGWFPGKLMEPTEMCLWYTKPEKFLDELGKGINKLRGWRRFISLKTVQGFGLYKCSLKDRSHSFVSCSASENAILAHFHTACFQKTLSEDKFESEEWARWATSELNNWQGGNTFYFPMPTESHLSLRLMTRWSRHRLMLASSLPMVLSLAIGLYYMNVSADTQTAWTVSSYIITAGAFLIAVLAVLTSLQDGGNDLGEAKKHGADAGLGV